MLPVFYFQTEISRLIDKSISGIVIAIVAADVHWNVIRNNITET